MLKGSKDMADLAQTLAQVQVELVEVVDLIQCQLLLVQPLSGNIPSVKEMEEEKEEK